MATSFRKFLEGLRIIPKAASTASEKGDLDVTDLSGKLNYHNGTSASPVVTEAHQATLTNKTLTSPVLNTPTADTITGIVGGTLTIQSASNEDLSLQAQGSGSVSLEALTVDGNTVTGGASVFTLQSDTDQDLFLQTQGTGNMLIQTSGVGTIDIYRVSYILGPSAAPMLISSDANQDVSILGSGAGVVNVESVKFDANTITGSASSFTVQSASNQNLTLQTQGSGTLSIQSTGTGVVTLDDVTTITGKSASTLTIQSDTNQNLNLSAQGTGLVSAISPTAVVVNSSTAALRVTQTGLGDAILIEDSANPDSSPFVVDSSGKVAIGATTANTSLDVAGTFATRYSTNSQTGVDVLLSVPSTTFVRLTGLITNLIGIGALSDGQRITLVNKSGASINIINQSSAAASSYRIITGTGSNIILKNDACIELIYDAAIGRWTTVGAVAGNLSVRSVFFDDTLTAADNVILAMATTGPINLTVPVSPAGKVYIIKKCDSTNFGVSITPDAGSTIDLQTVKTLMGQFDSVQIVSDGVDWFII